MKKVLFSIFASALALVSCNKENNLIPAGEQKTLSFPSTITAVMDDNATKTDYDASGVFSWVLGDRVRLVVTGTVDEVLKQGFFGYSATSVSDDGKTATFTADNGGAPIVDFSNETWTSTGFAVYPYTVSRPQSGTETLGYPSPFITLKSAVSGAKSDIVLLGMPKGDNSNFQFKTAMSVLKVTLTDIPAEATSVMLYTLDQDNYPIAGDFLLSKSGDTPVLTYTKYGSYHTGSAYQTVDISALGATASKDIYFNIPVGNYPANTLKLVVKIGDGVLLEKTLGKAINFERNTMYEAPALAVPAPSWTLIGTGKFRDNYIWSFAGETEYADVKFYQNTNPKVFRIEKPYPGENSDAWFVFDVTNAKEVTSTPYYADVEITNTYNETEYKFKPWVRNGDYGYNYSDVLVWQENGMPAYVEIGPCYRGELFATEGYGYQVGKDHQLLAVEIVFPGINPILNGTVSEVVGSYNVSTVDYWNAEGTTSITIAASDTPAKGNVMITEFDGHSVGESPCGYTYGTYSDGKIVFTNPTAQSTFYIDGNGASHVLANYQGGDVIFKVLIPGEFMLDSSMWLVGNRWQLDENSGWNSYWKSYRASRQ